MKKSEVLNLIKSAVADAKGNTHYELPVGSYIQVSPREKPEEKGLLAARIVRSIAATKGNPDWAIRFAKETFKAGDSDPVVKALAAGSATAGGFLIQPEYATEILALLRPQSVVRRMNPTIIPMDTGTLTMRKITGGSTANYIGENQNIPKSEMTFGQLNLSWKKLAALVPISNDLIRMTNPAADTIVRDDMITAMALREDQAFIRDDGTVFTPTGLRNLAISANVFAATQAGSVATAAEVAADLTKMRLRMRTANARMVRLGWLMSPRTEAFLMDVANSAGNYIYREEMDNGRLRNLPYSVTTVIPENLGGSSNESELYLVDFNDVIIGESQRLIIDASTEAAYHDGSQLVSAFGTDQTVIRAIAEHDMGLRYDPAVVVMTTVKWGA